MATGLTIETARERLQVVLASIASVDPAVLAAELKATLDEYIGALRSLHAGVTGGGIVKDPAGVLGTSSASWLAGNAGTQQIEFLHR